MPYIHTEDTHNLKAPQKLVPLVAELLKPKSVVDIGCGIGTFLHVFKELGVVEVLGVDGDWVDRSLLKKYINTEEFRVGDLTRFISLEKKFDLAVCLEVAEHLDEIFADNLVKTLSQASNVILFSAGIPFQGGQYHINEQWPDYWQKKFLKVGFIAFDIIRKKFWEDEDIDFWYKQNTILLINKDSVDNYDFIQSEPNHEVISFVHPQLYIRKSEQLQSILLGQQKLMFYLKLLAKAFLIKLHLLRR